MTRFYVRRFRPDRDYPAKFAVVDRLGQQRPVEFAREGAAIKACERMNRDDERYQAAMWAKRAGSSQ